MAAVLRFDILSLSHSCSSLSNDVFRRPSLFASLVYTALFPVALMLAFAAARLVVAAFRAGWRRSGAGSSNDGAVQESLVRARTLCDCRE